MSLTVESLTIDEVRYRSGRRQTTATALAEQHYERIAAGDVEIHSYLALSRERALAQAAKIDAMAQRGDDCLHWPGFRWGSRMCW